MEIQIVKCCSKVDLTNCYEITIECFANDHKTVLKTVFIAFCDDHIQYEDQIVKEVNSTLTQRKDAIVIDARG